MPIIKNPSEQITVEVPLYTSMDAARYLRVPAIVVLSCERPSRHPLELYEGFRNDQFSHDLHDDDYVSIFQEDKTQRISFRSLACLFVFSPVFRMFFTMPSHWHPKETFHFLHLSNNVARQAVDDARLFNAPDWVLSHYDHINDRIPDLERAYLLKSISLHQSRVDLAKGVALRLFPFSRDPAPNSPRSVVIDPELRFGRPTVKGVPTDILVERWRAGDKSIDLAEDYGLTTEEVDEALRYEATPYQPSFPFPFPPFGW